jgi:adenosylcobyric acid synthase
MARSIMIQGTMSNAGKSLLVTGLCRIFRQDGFRTAPFKSQNMALNSFITADGREIGRAQAVQAEAAGVPCTSDMNPILLKPTNDTGSQVIVNGIPRGDMSAREYFAYKKKLIPDILAAWDRLSRENDVIVIEGAGSPAEINLRENDIVNMGLAEMTDSPVLLAGDIDRGGVFAQLYGTVMLLEKEERARIRGLVINKFRGDPRLLDSGIRIIEEKCGIPVVGTIPWLDVDIDDEDSLSRRLEKRGSGSGGGAAVIRFPRISNFTDFHALEIAGFSVRYVSRAEELGSPDILILPGTKNTVEDLLWLRETGLAAEVLRYAAGGGPVIGICGGYQMMGEVLDDRAGTEGGEPGRVLGGLGLLPVRTRFTAEKCRAESRGRITKLGGIFAPLSGLAAEGYQVHMGVTDTCGEGASPFLLLDQDGQQVPDGCVRGNCAGTYLHGIFDGEVIARCIRSLAGTSGEMPAEAEDYRAYRERQYDLLAGAVRENLDMGAVYRMMGLQRPGGGK